MPTRTPDPTNEEVDLAIVPVDLGAAWDEILARLRLNLPPQIAHENTRRGVAEGKGLQVPKGYFVVPATPSEAYLNTICVRLSPAGSEFPALGAQVFQSRTAVEIISIEGPARLADQVNAASARVGLIYKVLYHFLTGCWDEDGRKLWSQLEPLPMGPLPGEWDKYFGFTAKFLLTIGPECVGQSGG